MRYDNDPRVVRVTGIQYELPSPEGWHVTFDGGQWVADARNEDYTPVRRDTVEDAIWAIIGEPQ